MKPQIAKLTRPRSTGVVERRRLFDRLDRISKTKIVWISAPAGSGKTTLVANWLDARKMPCLWYQADEGDADIATFFSYLGIAAKHAAPRYRTPLPHLTREYPSGVTIFTRHFFEVLFSRLKPPFCFVIDNYQDVPAESRFHETVRDGLGTVPDGVTVIIISRSDPPPMMSRLQMNRRLDIIGAEEMTFTFEESRTLIASQTREKPRDDLIKALFQKTAGWAAGLILLTRNSVLEGDLAGKADVPVEQLYDYFATEVYERTDDELRAFLLMTAFLPRITIRAADAVTGKNNSEQILSRLSRANFFTERHATPAFVSYQYHPLFRDFLLKKAWDRFSRDEISGIGKKAAAILEAEGQTEDAARLLMEAGEWQGLSDLVLRHAAGLMTAGRFRTLEKWLDSIPGKMTENNAWLLYWKASCHITSRPSEARSMFERAYALSLDAQDPTGSFLSWTGVVNTFMYEWLDFRPLDQWIAAFAELLRKYGAFPSPEVEERATSAIFAAMMFRQPQHPDLPVWTKRVQAVMRSTADPSRRLFIGNSLILYLLWTGRISEAGALVSMFSSAVKAAQGAPLPRLRCLRSIALYYFYASQPELGLRTVEQGLRLAEETGVHQTDLMLYGVAIYHASILGDEAMAQRYLERMLSVRGQRGGYADIYHASQSSLAALLRGDLDTAAIQAEISVRLAEDAGVPLILNAVEASLVFVLTEARQYDKIGPHIAELRKRADATGSAHIEAWCSSCEARLALEDGNDALFAGRFKRAIDASKKTGLRLLTVPPAAFSRICAKALDLGLESDFVKELITLNKLIPDSSATAADSWPFPLKVYTLGRYTLLRDGKPVVFSGKVQQKPLAMLKALIAFGGKSVSEAQLIDALWPESEGDSAQQSFDTTLHRLRKLLGDDEAILLQEGQMSLNNARAWTDARDFESLLCRVEDMWKHQQRRKSAAVQDQACPDPAVRCPQPHLEETIRLTEKALALYKGHFLSGDGKEPWTISLRERLRAKFLFYTKALCKYWQQSGRYDLAIECYQNGIGIDGLAEELYQQLMICHQKLGQEAEVVKVYYRCRSMLHKAFGLEPSTKTRKIYSTIRRNG